MAIELPRVGPTELAMLVLNECIAIEAAELEPPEEVVAAPAESDGYDMEDGELAPVAQRAWAESDPPDGIAASVLYDLASDWMEHLGWSKLAGAVPRFVPFARAHPRILTKLECACFTLHGTLAGNLTERADFRACLAGVRSGIEAVPKKRMRHGRLATYAHAEVSVTDAVNALAGAGLFGSAHVLVAFGARTPGARCVTFPEAAVDDLVDRLTRKDGTPGGEYSIVLLPPGRVAFTAAPDVIAAFLASVPVRVLASERGATSRCPMDSIVAGLVDSAEPLDAVQAAGAMKKLIARDEATKPVASRTRKRQTKRAAPSGSEGEADVDGDGAAADGTRKVRRPAARRQPAPATAAAPPPRSPTWYWTPSFAAAYYRELPRLLDSLFERNVALAMVALGAMWCMPDTAYVSGPQGPDPDATPIGIFLAPAFDDGSDPRFAVSEMLNIAAGPGGARVACHGNLLAGLMSYLLPERIHELDHRLADRLEVEVDRLTTEPTPEELAAAEADGMPPYSDQRYGALKLAFARHRQTAAYIADGGPLRLCDAETLEQFYALCGDAGVPVAVRRALFCCVTVLVNEALGVYTAKFPIALRRPWCHGACTEHAPGKHAAPDSPPGDAADDTYVFRSVVEALVLSGCQHVVRPPDWTSVEATLESRGRYGFGTFSGSVPTARPVPARPPPVGRSDDVMFEHTATLQVPFLRGCGRVMAFFAPSAARARLMGQPCVSLSTLEARAECTDEAEDSAPVGARYRRVCPSRELPAAVPYLCGRFTATNTRDSICSWCLFRETSPSGASRRRLDPSPCAQCAWKDGDGRSIGSPSYHEDCISALGAISTNYVTACPACLTPFPRGSSAATDPSLCDPLATVTADLSHNFANTAYSISVRPGPPLDPRLRPMPKVCWEGITPNIPCCVCGADRKVFAWTYVTTVAGTARYDFDCEACANVFDASVDAQVGWNASLSLYPMYTTGPNPWRRPFLKFAPPTGQ
jgi:hypothetical protein